MIDETPLPSFFMAGFECSTQRRKDGVRLDLIKATGHDTHAFADYRRCAELGITGIRDGLRWHLIGSDPAGYQWDCWLPMLDAAEDAGVQVIWDLYHYGSPDHLTPGTRDFEKAFADYAAAAVRLHRERTGRPAMICPVNEISFFAWAVETGYFPPVAVEDGSIKQHLVRCWLAAVDAIRAVDPDVRFIGAEPLIHVAPRDHSPQEMIDADNYRRAQFEAYDMITGGIQPELGGRPDAIDLIGLNFYPHNQWYYHGPTIPMGHHEYRPLADMLVEVAARYAKPIFIAETGAEGSGRPAWFHYVCDETRAAMARGARVEAVCLYPVTAYPGWDNSRHAEVGLFTSILADGSRALNVPLYDELERQRGLFGLATPETAAAQRR